MKELASYIETQYGLGAQEQNHDNGAQNGNISSVWVELLYIISEFVTSQKYADTDIRPLETNM